MRNSRPILLVEDDQVGAITTQRALKELEVTNELVHKGNGEEALEHLRDHLLRVISESRAERHRTVIEDFHRDRFEPSVSITRIGGGSLGGKARGVAFANRILSMSGVTEEFPEIDIHVPPSVVLATQIFDEFLKNRIA